MRHAQHRTTTLTKSAPRFSGTVDIGDKGAQIDATEGGCTAAACWPGTERVQLQLGSGLAVGSGLLFLFLQKIGAATAQPLRERVAPELRTNFAGDCTRTVSLAEASTPLAIGADKPPSTRRRC